MVASDIENKACSKIVSDAIRRHFPKAFIQHESPDYNAARFCHDGEVYRVANVRTGGFLVERVEGGLLFSDEKADAIERIIESDLFLAARPEP